MKKMLEDLEEVVRIDRDKRAMYAAGEMQTSDALRRQFQVESAEFIRTHQATIRDLAARLEALQLRETQLVDAVSLLQKRLEECEQEWSEEARLNGMGSEREAALMAKLAVAERDAARYAARYAFLKRRVYVEDHDGGWSSDFKFYAIARHSDSTYKGAKPFQHETLDDAIDAAMQEAGR